MLKVIKQHKRATCREFHNYIASMHVAGIA